MNSNSVVNNFLELFVSTCCFLKRQNQKERLHITPNRLELMQINRSVFVSSFPLLLSHSLCYTWIAAHFAYCTHFSSRNLSQALYFATIINAIYLALSHSALSQMLVNTNKRKQHQAQHAYLVLHFYISLTTQTHTYCHLFWNSSYLCAPMYVRRPLGWCEGDEKGESAQ